MDANAPAQSPEKKTVELWAAQKATPAWLFAAARAYERWGIGSQLTEADFDAALARAQALQFR
jgi:hypothetical protein